MGGRILTISQAMHTRRWNATGEVICASCPTEFEVGDRVYSSQSIRAARPSTNPWRCLPCARRLNLVDDE